MGTAILVPGADWRNRNLGRVTPTGSVPAQAIFIVGDRDVQNTAQFSVAFYPVFATDRNVEWSIVSGSEYATISSTGMVTALSGASASAVTIRATYVSNPDIYIDKTIYVTYGSIAYYDYIESDGTGYLLISGLGILNLWGATLEIVGTLQNGNGYLFGVRYALSSTQARAGFYNSSQNKISVLAGKRGFLNSTTTLSAIKYKAIFKASTNSSTPDAAVNVYNAETEAVLYTLPASADNVMVFSGILGVFTLLSGSVIDEVVISQGSQAIGKIYSLKITDANDNLIVDLVPALQGGVAGMMDRVTNTFFASATGTGLSVGNDE